MGRNRPELFCSGRDGEHPVSDGRNHKIRKTYHYDAFGAIKDETGEISNRLTFTGQMYDGETGQYYLRARFYNPLIGRFTQEDIYRGDGLNLYVYCANNPVVYYDPSGYIQLPCILKYTLATDPYASTNAVPAPGKNASHSGHTYEEAIRNTIYQNNNLPYQQRKYTSIVGGETVGGVADNINSFNGQEIAIEAKYADNWSGSIRNPYSSIGSKNFAIRAQAQMERLLLFLIMQRSSRETPERIS